MRTARQRSEPVFWKAVNRFLAITALIAAICLIILSFAPELARRSRMLAALDSDNQELAAQQLTLRQREREIQLLEKDPEYVETIARDKLDLMKDGETIFRFDKKSPSSRTSQTKTP